MYQETDGWVEPEQAALWLDILSFDLTAYTGFRVWESFDSENRIAQAKAEPTTYKLVEKANSGAQAITATAISLVMATMLFA